MHIMDAKDADFDPLVDIWERAVRATHDFLTEENILYYRQALRETYLAQVELCLAVEGEVVTGFMGLVPPEGKGVSGEPVPAKVTMLFVAPEYHGKGTGRALLRHAGEKYGALEVDVNEQNPGALRFYEKCGFVRHGRSETDGEGNPFPLLHLRREG